MPFKEGKTFVVARGISPPELLLILGLIVKQDIGNIC
jgi:hypothetical protein